MKTDEELGKVAWSAYYHADTNCVWETVAIAVKKQVLADLAVLANAEQIAALKEINGDL